MQHVMSGCPLTCGKCPGPSIKQFITDSYIAKTVGWNSATFARHVAVRTDSKIVSKRKDIWKIGKCCYAINTFIAYKSSMMMSNQIGKIISIQNHNTTSPAKLSEPELEIALYETFEDNFHGCPRLEMTEISEFLAGDALLPT
ncbi:hypothetical protein HK096_004976, partial [Nowakowskiella sp. JEL0078]